MAKPQNIDEYYEKMSAVRAQVKSFRNSFAPSDGESITGDAADLYKVTDNELDAAGLDADRVAIERARLNAMKNIYDALQTFIGLIP